MTNNNHKKKRDNRFPISLTLCSVLGVFMVSGSTATMNVYAIQTLPTCTDPTGQNLPCIMFISTFPPPNHTLLCQETSGQIFKCTFIVDKLSNGNRIVAITVYVPANFVFIGKTDIKVVEHETVIKRTTIRTVGEPCPSSQILSPQMNRCVDKIPCPLGEHQVFLHDIQICVPNTIPPPPPTCDSKYYTGPCPPTDPNALTKCISAALVANDNKGVLGCATLLPDTPENAVTKCISAGLLANDNIAVLKCAKLLPSPTQNAHNLTNTTAGAAVTPPSNTSAAIQPSNASIPASSGGKGSGSTCAAGNCTSGTTPPVDCKTNPNDPSCPLPSLPTTQTCPDGSPPDSSGKCPTVQQHPSTTSTHKSSHHSGSGSNSIPTIHIPHIHFPSSSSSKSGSPSQPTTIS